MLRFTERTKFIKPFALLFTEHSKLKPSLNIQFAEQNELQLCLNAQRSEPFNPWAYLIPQYSERKINPSTRYMVFGDRCQWNKYKNTGQARQKETDFTAAALF